MKRSDRRWDELQNRWATGEPLSAAEEQERLAHGEHDSLARRELEVFAEMRARGATPAGSVAPGLVASALDALHGSPRLRLVTAHHGGELGAPALPARSSRVALFAVPSVLLAAASLFVFWTPGSLPSRPGAILAAPSAVASPSYARAELVLAAGDVRVTGRTTGVGQSPLNERESVTTGEGRACLTVDPGIDVCLAGHTAIELESLAAASIRLRVGHGTALARLSPRVAGQTFALAAGDVSALAHGTTYALRREGDVTDVIVVEGTVEVGRGSDERELVHAHSRVSAPPSSGKWVRTTAGRREEARLLALAPPPLWSGAALGVLELAAAPAENLRASVDDGEPLPLPLQIMAGVGIHRVGWRDESGAESLVWTEIVAGETRRLVPPPAGSAAPVVAAPLEKPSATSLLELARRELARSRPRQALMVYEQLRTAYPASAEARTVLVTMGKLELDLGRSQSALARFDAYLRGGGTLVPEALAGKARALRALGRGADERRAIQQYLSAQPGGFEAPLFAKRLRDLGGP